MEKVLRPFDPNDPKYFCCCGSYHILTGAKILAYVHLTAIILHLLSLNLLALISLIIVLRLLRGLETGRKEFLVPYLVYVSVILIIEICAMCAIFIALIALVAGYPFDHNGITGDYIALLIMALVLLCVIGVHSWFFIIVKNAYSYLKHASSYEEMHHAVATIGAEQTQQVVIAIPTEDTALLIGKDESVA